MAVCLWLAENELHPKVLGYCRVVAVICVCVCGCGCGCMSSHLPAHCALSDAGGAGHMAAALAVCPSCQLVVATAAPCLPPHRTQQGAEPPPPGAASTSSMAMAAGAAPESSSGGGSSFGVILLAMALKAMAYCLLLAQAALHHPLQPQVTLGTGSSSSSRGWGRMTSCQRLDRSTALECAEYLSHQHHTGRWVSAAMRAYSNCLFCCTATGPAAAAAAVGYTPLGVFTEQVVCKAIVMVCDCQRAPLTSILWQQLQRAVVCMVSLYSQSVLSVCTTR